MTTQYTTILKLALPVQGELSGTWGDVVNNNITQMVEQAIAGKATINSWTANAHTLTTADGTTSESRCAILELTDSGTALTGAGTVVCPTNTKLYIVDNNTAQIVTVTTSGGTGIAVPVGKTMLVYCDGTNVVEGVTHANSLSLGTSTVTADKILDEDNMASDSATAIATQQSIKAYVDSQVGSFDTLAEVLAQGNTTGGTDIAVGTGDDITFADSSKAIFGDGSDLQIYHDGSNSIIYEGGTGDLQLRGNGGSTTIMNGGGTETLANFGNNGAVTLYYDNAVKLATTATGIDVTGTATLDGLTVAGLTAINSTTPEIRMNETDTTDLNTQLRSGVGKFEIKTLNDAVTLATKRFEIDHTTGDISFYDDAAAQGLFWDSSASALGIGTTDPATYGGLTLQQSSNTSSKGLAIVDSTAAQSVKLWVDGTNSYLSSGNTGADPLILNLGGGNVGIGTASPSTSLDVVRAGVQPLRLQSTSGTEVSINMVNTGGNVQLEAHSGNFNIDADAVGIGTSSPAQLLNLESATNPAILITDTTNTTSLLLRSQNNTSSVGTSSNHPLVFETNATEAMRIDASGNALFGKTVANNTDAGTTIYNDNGISVVRDSNVTAIFNRLTSDGDIIKMRKDGTDVGSIGAQSGDAYISSSASGHAGLRCANGSILPLKDGSLNAGEIDLGQASGGLGFKDLYLSGGIQFDSRSNKLDDYEEGTWTPAYTGTTGGAVTYGTQTGSYTKVGNLVTVIGELRAKRDTLSGNVEITGLPFTNSGNGAGLSVNFASAFATDMPDLKGYTLSTKIALRKNATNAASGTPVANTDLADAATTENYLYFSATYLT